MPLIRVIREARFQSRVLLPQVPLPLSLQVVLLV